MDRKLKVSLIGTGAVAVIILVTVCAALIKRTVPSKEVLPLAEYYESQDGKASVILDDHIYEKKALIIDNYMYLDLETVVSMFNHRFYWDENENILTYATPTELIRAEVGNLAYYINKSKQNTPYAIVKTNGKDVYIALEFVKQYSDMMYESFHEPERIVIQSQWGEVSFVTTKGEATIRLEGSIKSPILKKLTKDSKLRIVNEEEVKENKKENKKFWKVVTEDGVIGYVLKSEVNTIETETLESNYEAPQYTHIEKEYKINMVWHQVTNESANANLLNLLDGTKGVNTISPTWFSVNSNKGTISSLANQSYVDKAHNNGIEVWALVDDFNPEVSLFEVMSHTSSREKLVNSLVSEAIKYNIDGINVDFEHITKDSAPHYLQFLRELSIKCRSNGIVLSIDNYVPASYNAFYNRKEQGEIADYVVIMGYDEFHATSKESGSVSSIGYFEKGLKDTLADVDKERVIMGIPFYTRVWQETIEDGETKVSSTAYTMDSAWKFMEDNGVTPIWDEATGQYYGEFESEGVVYKCWLEEEKSVEERMKIIGEAGIAGVSAWRLGFEKKDVWNIIIKYAN